MFEVRDILEHLRVAIQGKNMMVHSMYHYQCQTCNAMKPVYLAYGVEGPPELKCEALNIAIASPFMGAPCDICKGETQHVGKSYVFDLRQPPPGAYVYYIPAEGIDADEFSSVYMGSTFIAGR